MVDTEQELARISESWLRLDWEDTERDVEEARRSPIGDIEAFDPEPMGEGRMYDTPQCLTDSNCWTMSNCCTTFCGPIGTAGAVCGC